MSTVLSILGAILVISVLALVHELGHFYVGRKLGFGIVEFAVGMGPVIWKKEKNGVQYSLRAFPIGGMCRFEGEDAEAQSPTCFNAQKVWKRMLVVIAGPAMNVLFALLFAILTLLCYGDYMPQIVGFAGADAPAVAAGMREGDILLSVDGVQLTYYDEATAAIAGANSDVCNVVVYRDGEKVPLTLRGIYDAEQGRNMLGVTISPARYHFDFFTCVGNSVRYVADMVKVLFDFLFGLFKGQMQDGDVVGPVGTINIIGQAVRLGPETILRIAVLISINLAVVNLLPLPALDGGRLVFMLIEAIRRKPLDPEKEGMVHLAGFALLMLLVVFLTYKDIVRLLQ